MVFAPAVAATERATQGNPLPTKIHFAVACRSVPLAKPIRARRLNSRLKGPKTRRGYWRLEFHARLRTKDASWKIPGGRFDIFAAHKHLDGT